MIAIRAATRPGRGAIAMGIVGLLVAAVLWTHGGPDSDHMRSGDQMGMNAAKSMCVAIFEAAGGLVLLAGFLRRRRQAVGKAGFVDLVQVGLKRGPDPGLPLARAGPATLQVFRL